MKTLLVLTQHPALAEQLSAAVDSARYRVVHRASIEEAEPLLAHGLPDLCIVDVESAQVQGLWQLEKIRRYLPNCPLLVYTGLPAWEWEEEAYLLGGVGFVRKPVRSGYLNAVLEHVMSRCAIPQAGAVVGQGPSAKDNLTQAGPVPGDRAEAVQTAAQSLKLMRDVWAVLSQTFCAEEMLKQFMLRLREIIGVNRVVLFLRQLGLAGVTPERQVVPMNQMRLAYAIGLPAELLRTVQLSFDEGIARLLSRLGRILHSNSPEVRADPVATKEFELLGGQVAVPIFDQERLVGMAIFDRRLTGEQLSNTELELIFHLLERLGLALKNLWLHEQLAANNEILTEILRELSTGCVVIDRDLKILNFNRAARRLLPKTKRMITEPDFADLPQALGNKAYEVLKTGTASGPFKFELEDAPGTIFNVNVVPLFTQDKVAPSAVLLTAEDLTQAEKLKQLEIEAANLRLIKTMADRSAHDIGNALVPLSAHQQLLKQKAEDPDFISSLDDALAEGVRRIARRVEQLRFLANDELSSSQRVALPKLVEDAFTQARDHFRTEHAELTFGKPTRAVTVTGDPDALRWALFEIILNALQANPAEARVQVRLETKTQPDGAEAVQIEIEDNGPGFAEEAVKKAGTPFWTRRTVGMGLGLAVARKIIQLHRGRLEIQPQKESRGGVVSILLPTSPDDTVEASGPVNGARAAQRSA